MRNQREVKPERIHKFTKTFLLKIKNELILSMRETFATLDPNGKINLDVNKPVNLKDVVDMLDDFFGED